MLEVLRSVYSLCHSLILNRCVLLFVQFRHWFLSVAMSSLFWMAVGAVQLTLALVRRRSQLKVPRVGINPGILNLNLPAAKLEFHKNGHLLVNQGYHEVSRRSGPTSC
jgi:hypothetical protein